MKYHFKNIKNGQICEGYTVIDIVDHEAEIKDEVAILLAEKHGGELAKSQTTSKQAKPLVGSSGKEQKPKKEDKPKATEE